jgi:hypothetical protein
MVATVKSLRNLVHEVARAAQRRNQGVVVEDALVSHFLSRFS